MAGCDKHEIETESGLLASFIKLPKYHKKITFPIEPFYLAAQKWERLVIFDRRV